MIRYTGHVVSDDVQQFNDGLKEQIENVQKQGLVEEIQYQLAVQPNGQALHSALIIGRHDYSKVEKP